MRLHQPDRRSCGAASLVMARRLLDPHYAALVADQAGFAREVSTLHRRLTSPADAAGGRQVPWLRAIGTPPWAAARDLRLVTGFPYAVRLVRLGDGWQHLRSAGPGSPVVLYVGDRLLPRHVVLVTGADDARATAYEPASGRVVTLERAAWDRGRLGLAGWDRPWFVVSSRVSPER